MFCLVSHRYFLLLLSLLLNADYAHQWAFRVEVYCVPVINLHSNNLARAPAAGQRFSYQIVLSVHVFFHIFDWLLLGEYIYIAPAHRILPA